MPHKQRMLQASAARPKSPASLFFLERGRKRTPQTQLLQRRWQAQRDRPGRPEAVWELLHPAEVQNPQRGCAAEVRQERLLPCPRAAILPPL